MIKVSCLNCSKSFDAKRSTAKFCSPNCRVKFNNLTDEQRAKKEIGQKHSGDFNESYLPAWVKEIEVYCEKENINPEVFLGIFLSLKKERATANIGASQKKSNKPEINTGVQDLTEPKVIGSKSTYNPFDNPRFNKKI